MGSLRRISALFLVGVLVAGCMTNDGGEDGGAGEALFGSEPPSEPIVQDDGHPITLAEARTMPRTRFGMEYHGPIDMPELRDYARTVAKRLIESSPAFAEQPVDIDVFITSHSEPTQAFATPDGDIFLGIGMFSPITDKYDEPLTGPRLVDEDQLAFALAHEIAHIAGNHFEKDDAMLAQQRVGFFAEMVVTLATAENLTALRRRIDGEPEPDAEGQADGTVDPTMAKLAIAVRALTVAAEGLVAPRWNRNLEREADLIALDLMKNAGYREAGALAVIERIHDVRARQNQRVKEKLDEIVELVAQLQERKASTPWARWFIGSGIRLVGNEATPLLDEFAQDYDYVDERLEEIRTYYNGVYKEPTPGFPKVPQFNAALAEVDFDEAHTRLQAARRARSSLATYKDILEQQAAVRAYQQEKAAEEAKAAQRQENGSAVPNPAEAMKAAQEEDQPPYDIAVLDMDAAPHLAAAEDHMRVAISGWGGAQPYNRLVAYDIRSTQGNARYAKLNLDYGLRDGPVNVGLFKRAALHEAEAGNAEAALGFLDRMQEAYPDQEFYDVAVEVHVLLGQTKEASKQLAKCRTESTQRVVNERCEQKAKLIQSASRRDGGGATAGTGQSGTGQPDDTTSFFGSAFGDMFSTN